METYTPEQIPGLGPDPEQEVESDDAFVAAEGLAYALSGVIFIFLIFAALEAIIPNFITSLLTELGII